MEPIGPLACTSDGAYLAGGGASGRIYFWEVSFQYVLSHVHIMEEVINSWYGLQMASISVQEEGCVQDFFLKDFVKPRSQVMLIFCSLVC